MMKNVNFLSVSLTAIAICFFMVLTLTVFATFANLGFEAGTLTCRELLLETR